jgi:hypothetical protein
MCAVPPDEWTDQKGFANVERHKDVSITNPWNTTCAIFNGFSVSKIRVRDDDMQMPLIDSVS